MLHVFKCCHMKANITLKMDTDILREARILAAEEGTSISAMLATHLEELVHKRKSYDRARRRALIRLQKGFNSRWARPGSREELHER